MKTLVGWLLSATWPFSEKVTNTYTVLVMYAEIIESALTFKAFADGIDFFKVPSIKHNCCG